ncbi:mesoderm induction early response protein 1-like [Mercenaria mercenaria]|uniref:mesoderm induction early response protein 1-like n=1 Tax=Mercenaria mercenaria TaxID=6596 RepID=UPI001E1DF0D5|nr:mesoderm induction early response protein 1-like [Mercenaria mercenaria]
MATTGTGETTPSNGSSPETDHDFDPSADMMVHDYDDERTLEEEENLSGAESVAAELNDLEKEGDMPIEQLLAMYGYSGGQAGSGSSSSSSMSPDSSQGQDTRSSSEEEILSNQDLTLDKDEIARDLLSNSDEGEDKETDVHDLLNSVSSSQTARLLRSQSQPGSEDSESEDDIDYKPEEEWKKTISVGSSYQAVVPEGLCKYGDAPAYENEDRLLWDPTKMEDSEVEKYLQEIHLQGLQTSVGVHAIPTGAHVRDDEQALYLLLQCGHNKEEALRRRKMQAIPPTDPMSLWSEEECSNFETGLRFYGKDFYLIHQNKVKTRSVGELVQFYYLWKKTERHDIFANKTRLEKRRYTLHPGVTDYMERFLDDQETPPTPTPARDRSASPVHSLLFGDPKRNHLKPHTESGMGDAPSSHLKPHTDSGMGDSPSSHLKPHTDSGTGDTSVSHLKPQTEVCMSDSFAGFKPIQTEFDINTASPTVQCPDTKVHNPAEGDNICIQNGLPEEGYVPPFKKMKTDNTDNISELPSDLHSSTASTETQNHIDSLSISSVNKVPSVEKIGSEKLTDTSSTNSKTLGISSVALGHSRSAEALIQ